MWLTEFIIFYAQFENILLDFIREWPLVWPSNINATIRKLWHWINLTLQTVALKSYRNNVSFYADVCPSLKWYACTICLFLFWGFSSHLRIFHSYEDGTKYEKQQILTYTRHSWPLSSEGSLVCYTYCDTGHLFMMVISEDPWHSHLLPKVWQ